MLEYFEYITMPIYTIKKRLKLTNLNKSYSTSYNKSEKKKMKQHKNKLQTEQETRFSEGRQFIKNS